ncbi:MAG: ATP/GTP-binding protein [Gammaproteobacteria bacterium]|nr:ATP/GTP-binding protein [Gammaproteobacteria bacterium]MBU1654168.1 ATP/GTP-binding protein [Gammaproteobacteria bacterium]MBU1961830.1 ATP/GTP-binding protein [Gammaproteobacteria bacterium]
MNNYKILVTGPVGSGKTTSIRVVSDQLLETDEKVSDRTLVRKPMTTVAMDYGTLRLSDNETVHLYGTPGQPRFKFMWDVLTRGIVKDCLGVMLLIDNARNYPYRDLKFFTDEFKHIMSRTKTLVGVTRSDVQDKPTIDVYHSWMQNLGLDYEVFYIDARKGSDVLMLVENLLAPHCFFSDWRSLKAIRALDESLVEEQKAQKMDDPEPLPAAAGARGEPVNIKAEAVAEPNPASTQEPDPTPEAVPDPAPEPESLIVAEPDAVRETGIVIEGPPGEIRPEPSPAQLRPAPAQRRPEAAPKPRTQPATRPRPAPRATAAAHGLAMEKIVMKEEIVQEVMGLRGVKGAALVSSLGDIVESTVEDGQLMEFISFLAGVAPTFEEAANLGRVTEVILKSPRDDVITLYVEDEQALGVVADNRTSVRILKQQIYDMLQWD